MRASPLLGEPPVLHLYDDRLLYLDRYWREEKQVCDDLLALRVSKPTGDLPASERLFPAGFEEQREAAEIALAQAVTVLTGGPGTGKTTTVARLLALLAEQAELAGHRGRGSRWRRRRARRRRGCRKRCSRRWPSWTRPIGPGSVSCRR